MRRRALRSRFAWGPSGAVQSRSALLVYVLLFGYAPPRRLARHPALDRTDRTHTLFVTSSFFSSHIIATIYAILISVFVNEVVAIIVLF